MFKWTSVNNKIDGNIFFERNQKQKVWKKIHNYKNYKTGSTCHSWAWKLQERTSYKK